jgi:hypothetical protein
VEPSEGSKTLISEPRGGRSDGINPQNETQNRRLVAPHLACDEPGPSGFVGKSPVPDPDLTRPSPRVCLPCRHPSDPKDPAHMLLAQSLDQQGQTQEAGPDPFPAPMTAGGKAKAFLNTNVYCSLAVITSIPLCVAVSVGFKMSSISTGAIVGAGIWTPLLIAYSFLLLWWRSQQKVREKRRREAMEVAAAVEGTAVDPVAMA